jgi:ribose transport system permease protein
MTGDTDSPAARIAARPPSPISETPPTAAAEPGAHSVVGRSSLLQQVRSIGLRYGMVWALIGVVIAAQLLDSTFLTVADLRNMVSQNAAIAIIAVGMTFVIIGGGFDLSVGGTYGIGAVVFAKLSHSMSLGPDLLIVVLVGLLAGLVNGIVIARIKINPFVATLGTASLFLGVAYIYSDSLPVPLSSSPHFAALGTNNAAGIPISGLIAAGAFAVGGLFLSRAVFGQSVRAVGSNDEAARLSGLRIEVITALTYIVTGGLATIAGAVDTSRLGTAQADQGSTLPLLVITVVILGGTSLKGGEGAMWRTVVGVLIIAVLTNLLNSLAVNTSVQDVIEGAVLLAAVSLDILARRLRTANGQV